MAVVAFRIYLLLSRWLNAHVMQKYVLRNTYMKRDTYTFHVCLKLDILYNCLTALQVASSMQCPYLSNKEGKKTCQRMSEEGLDGEVSEFDMQHFCAGNPVCCYYFRTLSKQTKSQEKALKDKINHVFTNVSRNVAAERHP